MVVVRLRLLLLCLLLLLPVTAQARLTLGWVKGAAILGTEDQARRLAAHLEARLAEPVVLRACNDEAQLHEWLHRYRMVDLAPLSQGYFQRVPAGQLLPVAEFKSGGAAAQMVMRQGLRSDQQLQLRTLLANLPEEFAADLLADMNGLRLSPPAGALRSRVAADSSSPAPPERAVAPEIVWPDAPVASQPVAVAAKVQTEAPTLPLVDQPVQQIEPVAPVAPAAEAPLVAPLAPPAVAEPLKVVEKFAPAVIEPPSVAEKPPLKLAALPAKPAVTPREVKPKLSEETVSRSLSSGRQPGVDTRPLQTIYVVPFTTIMVPLPVAEAVFDQFVETLNQTGPSVGYEFIILKDDFERVDPAWLRKATYVTGEIFGYVEESGCCSTDIRSKSRLALYRPGASEPKLRHEYPAKAFFDHDYSTLDAERKKLAERISHDLSSQLIKALGGG